MQLYDTFKVRKTIFFKTKTNLKTRALKIKFMLIIIYLGKF